MSIPWYVAYTLSYSDIDEFMTELCMKGDHTTINRWAIKYSPLLKAEFSRQHKRNVGSRWRMDATYVKVRGTWCYHHHYSNIKMFSISF
jgi:putative transposase